MAFVQEGSTLAKPKVLLGRVIHYTTNDQLALLRYRSIGSSQYKLDFDTGRWIETESNLFPVQVKGVGKVDIYKLMTSARTIHKSPSMLRLGFFQIIKKHIFCNYSLNLKPMKLSFSPKVILRFLKILSLFMLTSGSHMTLN